MSNDLAVAAAESGPAHEADDLRALAREFSQLPRDGQTVYGFIAGIYPTDYPTLPSKTTPEQATGGAR